jgi:hypothetical protein
MVIACVRAPIAFPQSRTHDWPRLRLGDAARLRRRYGCAATPSPGPIHRVEAAIFADGGNACSPRIFGIGGDPGHRELAVPALACARMRADGDRTSGACVLQP